MPLGQNGYLSLPLCLLCFAWGMGRCTPSNMLFGWARLYWYTAVWQ